MKRKMPEWSWVSVASLAIVGIIVSLVLIFVVVPDKYLVVVVPDKYLVVNPSEEQVRQLLRGDPENRVWFEDANQLMGNKYMLEITYKARYWEGDRIAEFLEEVGVEYELLEEGK